MLNMNILKFAMNKELCMFQNFLKENVFCIIPTETSKSFLLFFSFILKICKVNKRINCKNAINLCSMRKPPKKKPLSTNSISTCSPLIIYLIIIVSFTGKCGFHEKFFLVFPFVPIFLIHFKLKHSGSRFIWKT